MERKSDGTIDISYSELAALVDRAIGRQGPPLTAEDEDETMAWLTAEADRFDSSSKPKGELPSI